VCNSELNPFGTLGPLFLRSAPFLPHNKFMAQPPSPIIAPALNRLDGVDLLRGLAIFFVLMNHVNMRLVLAGVPYTEHLPPQLTTFLFWSGQRGVQIFFAISGFLITSTTLRRWGTLSQVSLRGFYLMRFARIAPLLLILLAVLSVLHLAHIQNFIVSEKTGGLPRALFAALTFHINVLEARRGYLPGNWDVLWSLSIEEMFYLFFPVLARIFGGGKFFIVLLLSFVALGPLARTIWSQGNDVWQEYSYLGGMDAIAVGCLTALAVARYRSSGRTTRLTLILGVILLAFGLCFSRLAWSWGLSRTGLDMTIIALSTCLIIAAVARANWRAPRALSPLRNLGQRSYEIYLTHMFVVFAVFNLFVLAGKPMFAVIPLFVAVIVISAVFGEVVARFYSEPLNSAIRTRWRGQLDHVPGKN
jgi:peptidoglycan/LPS O-acetylase OafA/YrhL